MRKLKTEELQRLSIEEFKIKKKIPLVLVLDNVRSMANVGSTFRTGDAFRIEKILLCGITAQPPHREINKTALGATDSVDWAYTENTTEAISELKKAGYTIAVVEQAEGSTALQSFMPDPAQKIAVVFGNEVFGVSDEVIELADVVLEIPQYGTKHSLNISVTVGIVTWDIFSKMNPPVD
ncbi:RNA methyltransferase [Roseivirga sp. BDSF3-8]|uniref:RNA methyltransferase n=1 Tax=Roseivirga sp. BDSF3-8 TaxID=3241598 RepID=UPI00353225B9